MLRPLYRATTRSLRPLCRPYSSPTPPASRISRLESRLPRFLSRIIVPLRNAPVSHITAFLILHEITAIAPLIGLAATFHYTNWLPPYISEWKWAHEGMQKYGNYLRKKGWIQDDSKKGKWWGRSEGGVRVVVEVATAYAITKALLPLRLVVSVWGSPWFAKWAVLPFTSRIGRLFSRAKGAKTANTSTTQAAAGTGATGAGAVPKEKPSTIVPLEKRGILLMYNNIGLKAIPRADVTMDVTTTAKDQSQSRLFGIPAELRNRIYEQVALQTTTNTEPALFRAGRQIRNEGLSVFYTTHIFAFSALVVSSSWEDVEYQDFLTRTPTEKLGLIQQLRFERRESFGRVNNVNIDVTLSSEGFEVLLASFGRDDVPEHVVEKLEGKRARLNQAWASYPQATKAGFLRTVGALVPGKTAHDR